MTVPGKRRMACRTISPSACAVFVFQLLHLCLPVCRLFLCVLLQRRSPCFSVAASFIYFSAVCSSHPKTIDPTASTVQLNSTKMDIKLKKAVAEEWPALTAEEASSKAASHT